MKKCNKKCIKILIFILIFIVLLDFATQIFNPSGSLNEWYQSRAITQFYDLKKNSIDIIYLGNSLIYSDISPYEIYINNKITGYDLANPNQFLWSSYYLLKEAYKTQKPKLVFISTDTFIYGKDSQSEYEIARAIDSVKFDNNKIQMINDPTYGLTNYEKLTYIFPILRYHTRWNGKLSIKDFKKFIKQEIIMYKGQFVDNSIKPYIEVKNNNQYKFKIPIITENYIKKIKQLCDNNNTKLILVTLPSKKHFYYFQDEILRIASNLNVKYLDLSSNNIANIDWNTDTRDGGEHLNTYGAKKISKIISEFIEKNYQLNSHDEEEWNNGLKKYKEISNKTYTNKEE